MFKWNSVILIIMLATKSMAQVPGKIEVLGARTFEFDQDKNGKIKKLIGDVKLKQDNTLLYCDSAYQYEEKNYVEAFGHIHINTNDTTHIYGDLLQYDGNTKIAKVQQNVRMNDNNMQLTTNEIVYDINSNTANYSNGGKIINGSSTLTSINGYYNTKQKVFLFKNNVVLNTIDYVIKSDTLKQNTTTNTSYFLGPSTITSNTDTIYCENGWYDNARDLAMFSKNAKISNKDNILFGDSLFYNRKEQYGKGYGNIKLIDKLNAIEINGDFGEYKGKKKQSYVSQRAYAKKKMDNDSIYLLADTIYTFQRDTILKQQQLVKAFHNAQILKLDLQAVSDSLVYNYVDSTITLYHDPIMWSGVSQITADTVKLFINKNKLDSFYLLTNAFMISRETAKDFSQVKGKMMKGLFEESKFKYIHVYGNGQSIFYAKDEKDSSYIGVNVIDCSEMEFYFANNTLNRSNFITKPDASFYPIGELKPEELKLKGFRWLPQKRPSLSKILKYFIKN